MSSKKLTFRRGLDAMRRHHWAGALVGRRYEVALLERYKGVVFGYRHGVHAGAKALANGGLGFNADSPGGAEAECEPPSATDLVQHTYNQLYAVRGAKLGPVSSGAYQRSVVEWR